MKLPVGGDTRASTLSRPAPRQSAVPVLLLTGFSLAVLPLAATMVGFGGRYYPASSVSILAYFAVAALLPAMRPHPQLLSPRNVALGFWFLVLVGLPLVVSVAEPARGTLPGLPSASAIDTAMLLNAFAFVAFSGGLQWAESRRPPAARVRMAHGAPVIGLCLIVGVSGVITRIGSFEKLSDYFRGSGDAYQFNDLTGVRGLLATILPPFLTFGCVALMEQWRRAGRLNAPKIALAAVGGLSPLTLYSYNRGAVVVPAIAIVGALLLFARRRRTGLLISFLVLLAGLAFLAGNLRHDVTTTQGGKFSLAEVRAAGGVQQSFLATIQLYGQGPQFAAYALGHEPQQRFTGDLLVSSLMSPVPGVGRPFRPFSGTAAYNVAIYGNYKTSDQIVPISVETWWSLGPLGVACVFWLMGFLVGGVHRRFLASSSLIEAFGFMMLGSWLGAVPIVSLLVLAQILVYFFWAPLVLATLAMFGKLGSTGRIDAPRPDPGGQLAPNWRGGVVPSVPQARVLPRVGPGGPPRTHRRVDAAQ